MKQSEAMKYINAMGLKPENNGVSKLSSKLKYEFKSEEELHAYASNFIELSMALGFDTVRIYVYRMNNMIELMIPFLTGVGVSIATLEQIQEHVKYINTDDPYMLIIEVEPGKFSLV